MSNLEVAPPEVPCGADETTPALEVIGPREVPLGGPRAMTVRRTLPTRARTMVGAWCFVDHYGPDTVSETGGMVVPPHPHTGLATVSWLFTGTVEHRDSLGTVADVVPGELNLMTAGRGISHSEVSTPQTTTLHGVQLWFALPAGGREDDPAFEHFAPTPVESEDGYLSVFLGQVGLVEGGPGSTEDVVTTPVASPVRTPTPLLGAEVVLRPGGRLTLTVDPDEEHGILVDGGPVRVAGETIGAHDLAYLAPGRDRIDLAAGEHGARVILLGGPPFGEQIVMWWNFIGRTHEDIAAAREQWQAEIGGADAAQFGRFDYDGDPLPAPALPGVRLRPRG